MLWVILAWVPLPWPRVHTLGAVSLWGVAVQSQELTTLGIPYPREQMFLRGLFPSLQDTALGFGEVPGALSHFGLAVRAVTACSGHCSWGASARPVEVGTRPCTLVVLHGGTEESGPRVQLPAAPEATIPGEAGVRPAET